MSGPVVGIWHPGLSSNYGDRAIQRATVDLVFERWPTATVVQYDDDLELGAREYPDPRVRFERLGPLGLPPLGKRLAELDILLWGGGSLIQQSSLLYLPWHLLPAFSAARRGVPVVVFGSGVEPLRSRLLRRLVRKSFADVFVGGFVRGPLSAELLASYGVHGPIPYAVDQATGLAVGAIRDAAARLGQLTGPSWSGPVVSVSLKPSFIYRGGLLPVAFDPPSPQRARRRRQRRAFEESFAQLVRYLVDEIGAHVVVVPMFLGQGDIDAGRRVAAAANRPDRVSLIEELYDPRDMKAFLSQMDAHVGVRLHSCVLATGSGVPSLAIEYMTKHRDFFAQLEMTDLLIPEDEVTAARLIGSFTRLWQERELIGSQLVERKGALLEQLRTVVDEVLASADEDSE